MLLQGEFEFGETKGRNWKQKVEIGETKLKGCGVVLIVKHCSCDPRIPGWKPSYIIRVCQDAQVPPKDPRVNIGYLWGNLSSGTAINVLLH